jgi:predicted membrane protein
MEKFENKEKRFSENKRRSYDSRIGFGVLLVFVGGLFLLKNFGMIPYEIEDYIFNWKMLLIGIGVINIVISREVVPGIVLIAIGSFFLLPDIFDLSYSFRKLFWPVIIVIIGLVIIFRKGRPAKRHPFHSMYDSEITSEDYIDEVAIFGGSEKQISSKNFKGGKITNIFGGGTLDFTDSELAEGNNIIDMVAIFGGSKFIVPSDWNVKTDIIPIFGGFSDKRKNVVRTNGNNKTIIFKGVMIFGGGEIKSY